VGVIRAVRAVVHDGASVDEAHAIYTLEREQGVAGRGLLR
jgi:hypothetical protein